MQSERSAGGWRVCTGQGPKAGECTNCMNHYSDLDYSDEDAKNICTTHGRKGDSNGSSFDFSGWGKLDSNETCDTWGPCVYAK